MEVREAARIISYMQGIRAKREAHWRKMSRWICPWRGRFEGKEAMDFYEGDAPYRFTHVASNAVLRGASGMTSGMTPRNISWFKPSFKDPAMMEMAGARTWLDALDRAMKDALSEGGFYQAIQNFNLDLLWAGCALLYTETQNDAAFVTTCCQAGSYLVQTDSRGRLTHVARRLNYSASEAINLFGEGNLSAETRRKIEKNPLDPIPVWHLVTALPKPVGDFTCQSFYFENVRSQSFLKEGYFHEMPYFFATWNEGSTPYGTGPGDMCLADAIQMNALEHYKLDGIGRMTNPPVACPANLRDNLNLDPGAINYAAERDVIRPILDMSPYAQSMRALMDEIAIVSGRLEQGLMAAIFASMPLDQRPSGMSATEFLERKRECLQQLGPVMAAYEPNVLAPLLFRCAATLDRENLAPKAPSEFAGKTIFMKMDFISPMANALRQTGAETTRAIFQDVAAMFQVTRKEELFDKLDLDQTIDELATGLGAPGSIVRADSDVEKIRKERAEAQAQAQQAQAMQAMAGQLGGMAGAMDGQAAQENPLAQLAGGL